MTSPLPPLSELLAWSTTHLTVSAEHWNRLADGWKSGFKEILGLIRASGWDGQAYEAADERTYWDSALVGNIADDLDDAAEHARRAADDVAAAQDRLWEAVTCAVDAGFKVDENYAVTTKSGETLAEQLRLQAHAELLADDIRWRAAALVDVDQHAGTRIVETVERLNKLAFEEHDGTPSPETEHGRGGFQLVNFFEPRQAPIPQPSVPDDPVGRGSGPSAADIRVVLEKLPTGNRPWIREVRTPEDLQRLWKWMEQNGIENPGRYGDPSRGIWKDLSDGSGVGQRFSAGSTKAPALDISLNGTDHWKVHINPQTGGTPEVPATPRTAVGSETGRGAVPPTVVERPAEVKAPPIRGGAPGGFPMGGVPLDGATPHLVEPPAPHSGDPDLPVVGDGRPDAPGT